MSNIAADGRPIWSHSTTQEKNVSELIDFPAFTDLTKYLNKDDYPYLTDAQRSAAETALTKYNAGESLTEDRQRLLIPALV
ncbi:hypothetical protein [Waltera sp.]|uniref:hypothetical protein n=1 Tax=Waltera sp. TaxID=2815806 RepID=UPI0039A042F3